MGFLERAIRRGISDGIGKAVGSAITKAVEPKATELANKAAEQLDQAAAQQQAARPPRPASSLENAFQNLERAASGYATEMSKNIKVCPGCGEASDVGKKFCPHCGTKMPEETLAQSSVCPSCGKQNNVGTKFCSDCGTKLPSAVQEENAAAAREAAVMEEWDQCLAAYPKWCCGGKDFHIEYYDSDVMFCATFPTNFAAQTAVKQYREVLQQNGFRMAGQYPDISHLYKKVNGNCYHVDTEHCFDGDGNCPSIYFSIREPAGGYDYVKPEPKKAPSFRDLFNR